MTITYQWNISELECIVAHNGLSNVVSNVHWRLDGTDEAGHTSGVYGVTSLESPSDPDRFTAYEGLTKDQVIDWVVAAIPDTIAAYKVKIEGDIATLASPPVITKEPPWTSAAPSV